MTQPIRTLERPTTNAPDDPDAADADRTDFERATALASTDDPGTFDVELDAGWASLVGVHGGYLAAIATRAAEATAPDRRARTIATTFHRSGAVGPARVVVEEVRRGRALSNVVAEVRQGDRVLISSRITLLAGAGAAAAGGADGEVGGVDWGAPRPIDVAPVEGCVPIEPGRPVEHFRRADGVLDPRSVPFSGGPDTTLRGHVRPLEDGEVDAAWLAMACDWFPPPAFVRTEPPVGGISVDMLVHVHRTPGRLGGAWLAGEFGIETSHAGLAVERGLLVTADGLPVAESMQTRWTIGRAA